jgi:NAD(P)-dependent dehydrogenase (short-subunit alcohol dehydrogenase family)
VGRQRDRTLWLLVVTRYEIGEEGVETLVDRLRGKVAIVTGASSVGPGFGNGMATAVQFAREGAKVLCVDRGGRAQRTAELITEEGGDAEAFRADVTVADEVQNMIAHCVERFGRVDILQNNVGIDRVGGPVDTTEASGTR